MALWNSNTSQPGGLEFEVMDMLYHLPFRDWLELDKRQGPRLRWPRPSPKSGAGDSGRQSVARGRHVRWS